MRILLVEDEKKIASFIKRGLTEQHYSVDVSYEGDEGLYLAEINPYDLIILDIMLPMIDGFSILKTIRQEDEKIPVLILSARGDTKDKVKGLRYGVDDYLSKPVDVDEFYAAVEKWTKNISVKRK